MTRQSRIKNEVSRIASMPDDVLRRITLETVRAIWWAVEDLDTVPEGLYPADVVDKHLQRGNIQRDGKW